MFSCNVAIALLSCLLMSACFKNKEHTQAAELKSYIGSEASSGYGLPLLKSFGLNVIARTKELQLPPPAGARKNAVSFAFTAVSLSAPSADVFEFLKPLFAISAESRVDFTKTLQHASLIHLLPPAFQVAVDNEFIVQNPGARVYAPNALMSLVAASEKELTLKATEPDAVSDFLSDRTCFRSFGELLNVSKLPSSNVKERNAGFAVGDFLVVSEGSKLRHLAIWLDQDLYFEAHSFGQTLLFRLATFEQLIQELALRSEVDLRTLKFSALRRTQPWSEIARLYRSRTSQAAQLGSVRLKENQHGQSQISAVQGLNVRQRLPE